MENQYAALSDLALSYRMPEYESSLTTLGTLNRDVLIAWTTIRRCSQHFSCDAPENLKEGNIIVVSYPNVEATYEVLDNDITIRAVRAGFVKAKLLTPQFYKKLADSAFALAQMFAEGVVEGVTHVVELK